MLKHELVNEMNELSALKVAIKCIEEQYPIDPLQKHIVQLEKSKADKKRAAEAAKPQSKRTHAGGCFYVPRITSMPDKASTEHTLRDFLIHMTGSMSMLPIVIIRRRSRALLHTLPILHIPITMEMATRYITGLPIDTNGID
ncbi:unnamed protein product [Musa banksii]